MNRWTQDPASVEGTRFRIIPQLFSGFTMPVTVTLSPPAGSVRPGPSDDRMYAITPATPKAPYLPPLFVPPYRGETIAPAFPDARGHFDHIAVDDPAFAAAHLYAATRFTMDVWEHYLGHPVRWTEQQRYPVLELVTNVEWTNAHSGPGFIETGYHETSTGERVPHWMNLDIVAHELGHQILFAEIGLPNFLTVTPDYLGFLEAFCDLIAVVTSLHIDAVAELVLDQTAGNLYMINALSRIAELSEATQVRSALTPVTLGDLAGVRLSASGQWFDPSGRRRRAHAYAMPLIGAMFDVFVEAFQERLVRWGAIPRQFDARLWTPETVGPVMNRLMSGGAHHFARNRRMFLAALRESRDMLGNAMAQVIKRLRPDNLTYGVIAAEFLEACLEQGQAEDVPEFRRHFELRGIVPGRGLVHAGGRMARHDTSYIAQCRETVIQRERQRLSLLPADRLATAWIRELHG
jgi:hypothetical protein